MSGKLPPFLFDLVRVPTLYPPSIKNWYHYPLPPWVKNHPYPWTPPPGVRKFFENSSPLDFNPWTRMITIHKIQKTDRQQI